MKTRRKPCSAMTYDQLANLLKGHSTSQVYQWFFVSRVSSINFDLEAIAKESFDFEQKRQKIEWFVMIMISRRSSSRQINSATHCATMTDHLIIFLFKYFFLLHSIDNVTKCWWFIKYLYGGWVSHPYMASLFLS